MTATKSSRQPLGDPIAKLGKFGGSAELGEPELQPRTSVLPYRGHSQPNVPAVIRA